MTKEKNHFQDLPHGGYIVPHRLGDHMKILQLNMEFTNAKLEVLSEVAKAWDMDLRELIEYCVNQNIRGLLEGSSDIGKALNKILCTTWLKELQGEEKEKEKELD